MKNIFDKIINHIKEHKKRFIVVLIAIILIGSFSIYKRVTKPSGPSISKNEVTTLKKGEFLDSVSENGAVISADSIDIYPQKTLPIKKVLKKVGDKVSKGDVIAELDGKSLKQQLDLKNASAGAASRQAAAQIKSANDRLNEALKNKKDGTNAQLQSAKNTVTTSFDAWQSALKTYNDYKKSIEEGYNPEIVNQNTARDNLIAQLDTARLNKEQAKSKKADTKSKINKYQDKYEEAKKDYDRAESKVESLNRSIRSKENDINDLNNDINELENRIKTAGAGNNQPAGNAESLKNELSTKQSRLRDLQNELKDLQSDLGKKQKELSQYEADKSKYKASKEELENSLSAADDQEAQMNLSYQNAEKSLADNYKQDEASKKTRAAQLETYRQAAESAKKSYEAALDNIKVADAAVNNEINTLKDQLRSAKSSNDNSVNSVDIKNLKQDLADTIVKAPISGTLTYVSDSIGAAPSGSIAKIETLSQLQVKSKVKEFDINKIKVGMDVEITSNALGKETAYKGKVVSIDPVPIEPEKGTQSKDVSYKTIISIDDASKTELKPGMNVKVKYIIKDTKNVLTVPTNAIYEKGNKNFVLALVKTMKGYEVKEFEVNKGLENDFETIVSGKDIKSNMIIINSPENYSNGMQIGEISYQEEAGE